MAEQLGATLETWNHWSTTLGFAEHLLPVVVNPAAPISPDSNMKALGKTPSRYNFRKPPEVSGFAKWTDHRSTMKEIGKWELEEDYGICIQSREGGLRAIDIDVPGPRRSAKIVAHIENHFPHLKFFRRSREGTGKVLLPFGVKGLLTKRVLKVDGGIIEILGEGQQWIAEGAYIKDGKVDGRYLWPAGRPPKIDDVPLITMAELNDLCADLNTWFGVGDDGWSIARERRQGTGEYIGPPRDDEIGAWLVANWEITGDKGDGTLFVRCPWIDGHSSDSGPSETQYAPPDERFEKGHFKCLHASCQQRTDADFLEAMGFAHDMSDAPDLPDEFVIVKEGSGEIAIDKPEPRYITDKKGHKEARQYNHELFLRDTEAVGLEISWDDLTAQIVWRKAGAKRWQPFGDEHYPAIVRAMDRNGFVVQQPSTIRPAVYAHAVKHRVDTFVDWIEALPKWDGVERVERFWVSYAGAADTPYIRAVALYSWTAQAGRALDPGCQADMVPILVSKQGTRKTSLIRAIAPTVDWFGEINLMDRDDDTTRKMRGKAVVELGELRGMHSRAKEDIKAFITRRTEEWVPKYQEFAKQFKRRFVFYGTTNRDDFLADETGERRYLPFEVGEDMQLEVEAVERDREQLWAEAVALWRTSGIRWQDAERLSQDEHKRFKDVDPWLPPIVRWLATRGALHAPDLAPCDMPYEWGTNDVLVGGLGKRVSELKRADQIRVGSILRALGATKKQVWGKGWLYRISRKDLQISYPHDDPDDLFQ